MPSPWRRHGVYASAAPPGAARAGAPAPGRGRRVRLYRAPAWGGPLPRAPDPRTPGPPAPPAGRRRGRCGHARAAAVLVLLVRPGVFTALWLEAGSSDVHTAGALCFLWLVPVQYAQAWRYLRIDHVDSHWMRCHGTHHPWFGVQLNPSQSDKSPWFGVGGTHAGLSGARWRHMREYLSSYIPVISFVLLLLASTLSAFLMTEDQLAHSYILFFGPYFDAAPAPGLQVLGRALAIFDTVFGRVAQMLNVGLFLLVFCHHLEDMAHLIDIFELRYAFNFPKILDRVAETQACLTHSAGRLHGLFTSSSLLGGLGLALCMRDVQAMPPYLVFCCTVYAAIQALFLLMIRALAARRQRLLDTAYSLKFTRACLHREQNARALVIARETGSTVDWLALTQLLEQRWVQFTLCGIDLQDGQLVTRCAWLVGLLVAGRRLLVGDGTEA